MWRDGESGREVRHGSIRTCSEAAWEQPVGGKVLERSYWTEGRYWRKAIGRREGIGGKLLSLANE